MTSALVLLILSCITLFVKPYESAFKRSFFRWNQYESDLAYVSTVSQESPSTQEKPALLLLPGFGVGTFHFEDNMLGLKEHFDVYSLDLLGQGDSWPDNPRQDNLQYSCEVWKDQICNIITNVIKRPVHLAGNSLGGYLAAILASEHREELQIKSINLINPTPFWGFQEAENPLFWDGVLGSLPEWAFKLGSTWFNTLRDDKTVTTMLSGVYYDRSAINDKLVDNIISSASKAGGPEAFTSIVFSPKYRNGKDFDDILKDISDIPITFVMGQRDPWVVPYWAQRAKRVLKDDMLYVEMDNSGHCPHQESPATFNFIIKSLIDEIEQHSEGSIGNAVTGRVTDLGELYSKIASKVDGKSFTEQTGTTVNISIKDGSPQQIFEKIGALLE